MRPDKHLSLLQSNSRVRCVVSEVESWVGLATADVDRTDSTCTASRTPHRLNPEPCLFTLPTKPAPIIAPPTRLKIVCGKLPSHEGVVVTTTRWRRLSISVVLPENAKARSHHGYLLALKHSPRRQTRPKPPITHARKVPPTPLFVGAMDPDDVWDRRNLLLLVRSRKTLSL